MATMTSSFTASGTAGTPFTIQYGDQATYAFVVSSGSGRVLLQRSTSAGQSWDTLVSATTDTSGTIVNQNRSSQPEWYRWYCVTCTAGLFACTITDADVDLEGTTKWQNRDGVVVMEIKESHVEMLSLEVSGSKPVHTHQSAAEGGTLAAAATALHSQR